MNSKNFREDFLKFFEGKSHKVLPSSSLIPTAPNLLFTNAGMNEFVPYFLGETSPYPRIVKSQKCLRAGGKHNDLEDVGFDGYHHTAFEMLGNWSFGDYFKKEAIQYAWELLTQIWGIPKERLFVTVYKPTPGDPGDYDEESYRIWEEILTREGLEPTLHIVHGNKKDNFWSMGDTGPCGPCSEIHINCSPNHDEKKGQTLVNAGDPWCIELWNLVFLQYNANPNGSFTALNNKYVDTGMGLERLAGIATSTHGFKDFSTLPSNYASDLFKSYFDKIYDLCGYRYQGLIPKKREQCTPEEDKDCACRILADHLRAACWAIEDRIHPGNTGRDYTLRHILRRAMLFAKRLGLPAGSLSYFSNDEYVKSIIASEEDKFSSALDRGLNYIDQQGITKGITGEQAFKLYDTYGFPFELTHFIAQGHNWSVDIDGFQRCMEQQKQRSKANQGKTIVQAKTLTHYQTEFTGYDNFEGPHNATFLDDVSIGNKTYLIFDKSPFYGEQGGQAGDRGTAILGTDELNIVNTIRQNSAFLHELDEESAQRFIALKEHKGTSIKGPWTLAVDLKYRQACSANHTATHLLHAALCTVLGTAVKQMGSRITAEFLSFDFSYPNPIDKSQTARIEELSNAYIFPHPVQCEKLARDKVPSTCIAQFNDKYGEMVRMVTIVNADGSILSQELCGGTHVHSTSEIGVFHITNIQSIGSGIKRIEAITGHEAAVYLLNLENKKNDLQQQLSMPLEKISEAYQKLLKQKRKLEDHLQKDLQTHGGRIFKETTHKGLRCVQWESQLIDPNNFRKACKAYLSMHPGVDLLWGATQDNDAIVTVFLFCSQTAIDKGIQAGIEIQKFAAACKSKGGGKPDFASCNVPESEFKQHWTTVLPNYEAS